MTTVSIAARIRHTDHYDGLKKLKQNVHGYRLLYDESFFGFP